MKTRRLALCALVSAAIIAAFISGRYAAIATRVPTTASSEGHSSSLRFYTGQGRMLYLVVDGDGIYCGRDRLPEEGVDAYVIQTMQLYSVTRVAVHGSDTARYGAVVTLIDKLRAKGVPVIELGPHPVRTGCRLSPTKLERLQ